MEGEKADNEQEHEGDDIIIEGDWTQDNDIAAEDAFFSKVQRIVARIEVEEERREAMARAEEQLVQKDADDDMIEMYAILKRLTTNNNLSQLRLRYGSRRRGE